MKAFLGSWDPAAGPAPEEMTPADRLTFRVGALLPIDLPEVRSFWAKQSETEGVGLECLVCGAIGPVEVSLPLPLKGVPGWEPSGICAGVREREGVRILRMERAQTSPICKACGESTHKALNALLAERKTYLRVGKLVYVFWTSAGDYSPLESLDQPDPETVRRLIEAYRTGRPETVEDAATFHATALSASGGRAKCGTGSPRRWAR